MIRKFLGSTIGIVGGGRACKAFLKFLSDDAFSGQRPEILGVADINPGADGITYARGLGIPTFEDYTEFFKFPNLETLLEITNSHAIIETIQKSKPDGVKLIDHFEARAIRDYMQVEKVRFESNRELESIMHDPAAVADFANRLMDRMTAIIERRNQRARDIEKELVDQERTLHQIIQGSTIPTFVINQNHVITHWNRAMENLTGVSTARMIGTRRQWHPFYTSPRPSMADVVLDQTAHPDIMKLYGTSWRRSGIIDGAYEAEGFFPNLGGTGKWCWFTAAPLKSPEGRIIGAIETLWDKTEEKDAERQIATAATELRRQSDFLAKLIRSSNDGIVATDEKLEIVVFNPEAERIFGHSQVDVLHRRLSDLMPQELAGLSQPETKTEEEFRELPWREAAIVSKTRETIPVRVSGSILLEGPRRMGTVAFFQDLREIKRLQQKLVLSERLAAIGQTVAGLAHGIKNILHGLKGGSYLVDVGIAKNDAQRLRKGWDMIKRNIERTSNLVGDLLSYSKEREPEIEECTPNEIAAEVCDLVKDRAEQDNIKLLRDFDPAIGRVRMDPHTLHTALLNLVTNALDACLFDEDTSKKWQVDVRTILEPGGVIRLEVADNGAGMSAEVKNKLFTSFFSTKGHRGTGLGLLVTRKLVEEHEGRIEVDSRLGVGTTFSIRLPHRPAAPAR